ncbi:MAG: alpha/beta hydrolase [Nitrospirales bacterium]|nr:alpha/beta hydrolase [Nitrospirales bacterium]
MTAYDYLLRQRHMPSERIVLFGRSLGGPVAGEVAVKRAAAGLILEGTFPAIQSMADHHYLGLPAHWFVNVEFNLADKVAKLTMPVLVMHGEQDSIVPVSLGRQVFDAAREPKRWYGVAGAEHNDVPYVGGAAYYQAFVEFIREVVPGKW